MAGTIRSRGAFRGIGSLRSAKFDIKALSTRLDRAFGRDGAEALRWRSENPAGSA
jgi:hypothetical protein